MVPENDIRQCSEGQPLTPGASKETSHVCGGPRKQTAQPDNDSQSDAITETTSSLGLIPDDLYWLPEKEQVVSPD